MTLLGRPGQETPNTFLMKRICGANRNTTIAAAHTAGALALIDACQHVPHLPTDVQAWDADFGWAANGDEIADPDGFGNFGVLTGDAFGSSEVGVFAPLGGVLRSAGPKTFNAETLLQLEVNTAANAGGTGRVTAIVFYTFG